MHHGSAQGPSSPPRLFKEIFKAEWIEVEKEVEKVVEKEVKVPVEKVVEKTVYVEVPVEVEKVIHVNVAYVPGFWEYVKILLKRLWNVV